MCKFTIENARTMSEARYMAVVSYEFYKNGLGNEENVVKLCGEKQDNFDSIIYESNSALEAGEKAMFKWVEINFSN